MASEETGEQTCRTIESCQAPYEVSSNMHTTSPGLRLVPAVRAVHGRIVSFSLFLCAFLIAGAVAAQAGEVSVDLEFSPDAVRVARQGEYDAIELEGGSLPEDAPGRPWLPARYVNVAIPAGARATAVRVDATEVLHRRDVMVRPAQPPQPFSRPLRPRVAPDAAAYAGRGRVPSAAAVLGRTQRLRGYAMVSVRVNPMRWIPAKRELFLATTMRLTVTYVEGAAKRTAPAISAGRRAAFRSLVSRLAVNDVQVDAFAPAAPTGVEGDGAGGMAPTAADAVYLLITSEALASAFQPLVDRRTGQGLTGALVTTAAIDAGYTGGDAQERIRNCIRDYYENHGTVYVCLGGDNTVVPDRDCYVTVGSYVTSTMPTDLYYGGLDGTWDSDGDGIYGEAGEDTDVDLLPEVWVGRIPVRTAQQATDYIGKLIVYETAGAQDFSGRLLLTGMFLWNSYSGDSRPTDFRDHEPVSDAHIWNNRAYREVIQPYRQPTFLGQMHDTRTSWDAAVAGDYALTRTNLQTRMNEGYHHVLMATHGASTIWSMESGGSFSTTHAAGLTNAAGPTVIYTIACNAGGFDAAEPSLSEAFVRNANGGAIVYMGCSRYGWGSPGSYSGGTSFSYARLFYEEHFELGRNVIGEAFGRHKMAMAASSGYNSSRRWVQFGLNLQGDPAITLHGPEPERALQIDVPDGWEVYNRNSTIPVRWGAGGAWQAGDKVKLECSTDSGGAWQTIGGAESLDYDAALFEWTPSAIPASEHCRVRVSYVTDPGVNDASDHDFTLFQQVYYVDKDAVGGANNGTSWEDAFLTIEGAMAVIGVGDEAWVAEGVYTSTGDQVVQLVEGAFLYGGFNATEMALDQRDWKAHLTTIDGEGTRRCVMGAADARLDGFVLRNGAASSGAGIQAYGVAVTITNNVFVNCNASSEGGAIASALAASTITDNILTRNSAALGGGIYIYDCSTQVAGNRIVGNTATLQGGGVYCSYASADLVSNLLAGNTATLSGGGIYGVVAAGATVANNTICGNSSGIYWSPDNAILANLILWENGDDLAACTATYSCIEDGDAGTGNIQFDPMFVEATVGTWSAAAVYDAATGRATLTCAGAGWTPDAFAGLTVNPQTGQSIQFVIVANTAEEILVWGDASAIAHDGDAYRINDYQLQPGSPCIDSADGAIGPDGDLDGNPRHDDPGMPNVGTGWPWSDMGASEFQGATPIVCEINLIVGWNLVSVSVEPQDPARDAVFPPAICDAVWEYQNPSGYVEPDEIGPKKGYWVKANQATTLYISGSRPSDTMIFVLTGWNLVGVVGQSIEDRWQPLPDPGNCSSIWGYMPPYRVPQQQCDEGRGYWIKAINDGFIWYGN